LYGCILLKNQRNQKNHNNQGSDENIWTVIYLISMVAMIVWVVMNQINQWNQKNQGSDDKRISRMEQPKMQRINFIEKTAIGGCIGLIHFYQKTAPRRVRESCRFEPSCSEYMILSLNKFGLIEGLKKGIVRLQKCKPPFGGTDYP